MSKKRRKRSARTIHVTIRTSRTCLQSKQSSMITSSIKDQTVATSRNSFDMYSQKIRSLQSNDYLTHQNTWTDSKNVVLNHHRKLKRLFRWSIRHILLSICIGFLLICAIVITIIIPILFIKKPKVINRIAILRWNRTGITIAGNTSSPGSSSTQFNGPWDLALDWQYNLYVTDRYNNRVQKFVNGSKIGVTIAGDATGVPGSSLNLFLQSIGIVVDDNENIYVADHNNHRVVLWVRGSTIGKIVAGNGIAMKENNTLWSPHGLQRDPNTGILYIADTFNCRIMRYLPNATSGAQVAGGNSCGNNYGQLNRVYGFHLDLLTNSVIIANAFGHNVVRWRFGESNWTRLSGTPGVQGATSTMFYEPSDVTLDPMGNIYVVDFRNHRIQFFWADESIGTTLTGVTGQLGNNATLLYFPSSLILDNQLNIYVADWYNHRIQKFLRY